MQYWLCYVYVLLVYTLTVNVVLAFALGLSTLNGLRLHPERLEFVLSML